MGKHARRLRLRRLHIRANADGQRSLAFVAEMQIEAAKAGDETTKAPRRISMLAYSGGAMKLEDWRLPVVVDLAGMSIPSQRMPILLGHDTGIESVLGQTDQIAAVGGKLTVAGEVLGESAAVQSALKLADRGFAWQVSIGASVEKIETVPAGKTANANGAVHQGPCVIARKSTLREVSVLPLGADSQSAATIAAGKTKELEMGFSQWLAAKGFSEDDLSAAQKVSLQAMYDAELATGAAEDEEETAPPKKKKAKAVKAAAATGGDPSEDDDDDEDDSAAGIVAQMKADAKAEAKRQTFIRKHAAKFPDIEAKAIEEDWDETKVELEVLRASRPRGPAIHSEGGESDAYPQVLEAALARTSGVSDKMLEESYDDKILSAADSRDLKGAGLHTILYETIRMAGKHVPRSGRMDDATLRLAFQCDRELQASGIGFSTVSLSGLLSNVQNKTLLQSFMATLQAIPLISAKETTTDFKQVSSYRLTAMGGMQVVAPTGEIKHMQLADDTYVNQLATVGGILQISRKDLINDDLKALSNLAKYFGRAAAIAREKVGFTLLLSNPVISPEVVAFFHANHKNLLTGGTSVLSIAGLTLGEGLFLDQIDKNGDPILVAPKILLVPTGLKVTADQLMKETRVNETTTANTPRVASNPHAGKWEVVSSPYLNSQGLSGQSSTAWYLLPDPNDVPVLQALYLNGRDTPIVEVGEPNFDTLGMAIRGYFDFGIALTDFRGGIKSNGA